MRKEQGQHFRLIEDRHHDADAINLASLDRRSSHDRSGLSTRIAEQSIPHFRRIRVIIHRLSRSPEMPGYEVAGYGVAVLSLASTLVPRYKSRPTAPTAVGGHRAGSDYRGPRPHLAGRSCSGNSI